MAGATMDALLRRHDFCNSDLLGRVCVELHAHADALENADIDTPPMESRVGSLETWLKSAFYTHLMPLISTYSGIAYCLTHDGAIFTSVIELVGCLLNIPELRPLLTHDIGAIYNTEFVDDTILFKACCRDSILFTTDGDQVVVTPMNELCNINHNTNTNTNNTSVSAFASASAAAASTSAPTFSSTSTIDTTATISPAVAASTSSGIAVDDTVQKTRSEFSDANGATIVVELVPFTRVSPISFLRSPNSSPASSPRHAIAAAASAASSSSTAVPVDVVSSATSMCMHTTPTTTQTPQQQPSSPLQPLPPDNDVEFVRGHPSCVLRDQHSYSIWEAALGMLDAMFSLQFHIHNDHQWCRDISITRVRKALDALYVANKEPVREYHTFGRTQRINMCRVRPTIADVRRWNVYRMAPVSPLVFQYIYRYLMLAHSDEYNLWYVYLHMLHFGGYRHARQVRPWLLGVQRHVAKEYPMLFDCLVGIFDARIPLRGSEHADDDSAKHTICSGGGDKHTIV